MLGGHSSKTVPCCEIKGPTYFAVVLGISFPVLEDQNPRFGSQPPKIMQIRRGHNYISEGAGIDVIGFNPLFHFHQLHQWIMRMPANNAAHGGVLRAQTFFLENNRRLITNYRMARNHAD